MMSIIKFLKLSAAIGLVAGALVSLAVATGDNCELESHYYERGPGCRKYLKCERGELSFLECPRSKHWNEEVGVCDEKKNIPGCQMRIESAKNNANKEDNWANWVGLEQYRHRWTSADGKVLKLPWQDDSVMPSDIRVKVEVEVDGNGNEGGGGGNDKEGDKGGDNGGDNGGDKGGDNGGGGKGGGHSQNYKWKGSKTSNGDNESDGESENSSNNGGGGEENSGGSPEGK